VNRLDVAVVGLQFSLRGADPSSRTCQDVLKRRDLRGADTEIAVIARTVMEIFAWHVDASALNERAPPLPKMVV
jgi:hypothetical protein